MLNKIRILRSFINACRNTGEWSFARFPFAGGPVWHRDYVNGFINKLADFPIPRDTRTIVDIGANVGLFARACEIYCPQAAIIAFEPSRSAYEQLTARCGQRVRSVKSAIGAAPGKATLHIAQHLAASTLRAPTVECEGAYCGKMKPSGETEDVLVTTLDAACREYGLERIDFLKIDVEGFEPEVIEGGRRALAEKVDRVMVEVSLARLGVEKGMGLLQSFFQMGYVLVHITDVDRSDQKSIKPVGQFDAWFVHSRLVTSIA